jgi:rhamnosyltransferase subunit B
LRIILSNIGTFGDINPLIAIALELKRRGHSPSWPSPPSTAQDHPARPRIPPHPPRSRPQKHHPRRDGLRRPQRHRARPPRIPLSLPARDLRRPPRRRHQPTRADLLLLGELNYAGPIVAEITGIPWASYVLAPLSFFSPTIRPSCPCTRASPAPTSHSRHGPRHPPPRPHHQPQMAPAHL